MRIDKYLSKCGMGSRTEVKNILKSKRVMINDELVINPKIKVDLLKDVVKLDNEVLHYKLKVYIMVNKPKGFISATKDNYQKTVLDLLGDDYSHYKLSPVGRLDKDTTGLLLLTNDGQLSHKLTSPVNHINKKYYVKTDGFLNNEQVAEFSKGIKIIDGNNIEYITKQAEIKEIDNDVYNYEVEINEGKYHQIKRMFLYFNLKVLELKRVSIGNLRLDQSLKLGSFRELDDDEVNLLKDS